MCIDAHEAAGQSDKALEYLQELVEWKRNRSMRKSCRRSTKSLAESLQFQTGTFVFDDYLLR